MERRAAVLLRLSPFLGTNILIKRALSYSQFLMVTRNRWKVLGAGIAREFRYGG